MEVAAFLFWPALAGYAEAFVAYLGDGIRPGRLARYAIWGVRFGWLAQTGLLVDQAIRAHGFPWGTWAGSLNLFVWLVVGAYLVWGCRSPFRLLGLAVMPVVVTLFALAWAAGGAGSRRRGELGDVFLAFHVGLVLAALMGVALAVWTVYAGFVLVRYELGWRGRRTAYLAVAGLAFVIASLVPVSH